MHQLDVPSLGTCVALLADAPWYIQEKQQHRHHRRTHHQRDKARKKEELANVAGVYGVRSSSLSQFSPAAALT